MQHEFYMWLVVWKPMQRAKCMFITIITMLLRETASISHEQDLRWSNHSVETMPQKDNEESAKQTRS